MEFHDRLNALIKERRFSQSELAGKIGVTPQRMSLWLKGTGTPKPEQLLAIAQAFNISTESLLSDSSAIVSRDEIDQASAGSRFTEKIEKCLRRLGISQRTFEERVGLPQNRLSKWRSGQGEPTGRQAIEIARFLELSVEYLLDDMVSEGEPHSEATFIQVPFHERLTQLCKGNGWSRDRFKSMLPDVDDSVINQWFSGKAIPDNQQALRLTHVFKVTLGHLFSDDKQPAQTLPEDEQAILMLYHALSLTRDQALKGLALMASLSPEELDARPKELT